MTGLLIPRARTLLVALVCGVGLAVACADPVHDDAVSALGPEQDGVPQGPTHRPGQPCLTCHGGEGPASTTFSVAGTVYAVQGQITPAVGAQVQIEDINGNYWTTTTNSAGNFYVSPGNFTPTYPTQPTIASADRSFVQQMLTHVGRDGSCAGCHTRPESNTSPGPVYLVQATAEGGAP